MADLNNSLSTMKIDYLDLWQIHDVRSTDDINAIEGPGGALEAFIEAKEIGLARFIGVTGHHDPRILKYAVENWPVDSILMPVNPVESVLGGFLDAVLTAAKDQGIAVIGMKVLGASHYINTNAGITPEVLIRFALSQEITTAIVGCSTPMHVRILTNAGSKFEPMSIDDQNRFV
jgi:predicted aldo/keto reductase-like oxidoreductase